MNQLSSLPGAAHGEEEGEAGVARTLLQVAGPPRRVVVHGAAECDQLGLELGKLHRARIIAPRLARYHPFRVNDRLCEEDEPWPNRRRRAPLDRDR